MEELMKPGLLTEKIIEDAKGIETVKENKHLHLPIRIVQFLCFHLYFYKKM